MFRLLAVLAVLFTVPAHAAGGSQPPKEPPKCSGGRIYNEKTKKCEDPQYRPNLYEKAAYGLIPPGFYVYCRNHPEECAPVEPTVITSDWMPVLERVNREVNASIRYKAEGSWDEDIWTVSPTEGDCDDYTVTKKRKLVEAGVPRGAMRAAYVKTAAGIDHVFLIVSTAAGDYVLDNGTDEVYELERAMLVRFSIQDEANPQRWWQVF